MATNLAHQQNITWDDVRDDAPKIIAEKKQRGSNVSYLGFRELMAESHREFVKCKRQWKEPDFVYRFWKSHLESHAGFPGHLPTVYEEESQVRQSTDREKQIISYGVSRKFPNLKSVQRSEQYRKAHKNDRIQSMELWMRDMCWKSTAEIEKDIDAKERPEAQERLELQKQIISGKVKYNPDWTPWFDDSDTEDENEAQEQLEFQARLDANSARYRLLVEEENRAKAKLPAV